jgi:hypothetical protein
VPSVVRPIPARPASAPRIIGPAPDDEETDPGARPLPPVDVDTHVHEPDLEAGDDELPLPVTHVDPHDDVAWGQGPTVLKSVGFDRIRRPNGRRGKGRRQPGGGSPPLRDQPPAGPPPGDAGAAPGPAPRHKGRRRHGRREGGGPGGPPPTPPGGPGGDPPSPERSPGETPPVPGGPGEGPGGGGHRRRHRRRRHGRR